MQQIHGLEKFCLLFLKKIVPHFFSHYFQVKELLGKLRTLYIEIDSLNVKLHLQLKKSCEKFEQIQIVAL